MFFSRARSVDVFGIDLRSAAAMRIALALLVLWDLAARSRLLSVLYTDAGVLPRELLDVFEESRSPLALHAHGGSSAFQAALFAIAALFALMLLVGYRARFAAFATFVLATSLQFRNELVLDGGDTLMRLTLLWAVFVPIGARWSIGSRRSVTIEPPPTHAISMGTVIVLAQIAFVFVFTALLRTGPEWRAEGSAIWYVMNQSYWARPLAGVVLGLPAGVVQWMTWSVLAFELLGPLLLFCPWRTGPVRTATVVAFWLFLATLGSCIELNMFPLFVGACLIAFLPSWFWTRVAKLPGETRRVIGISRVRAIDRAAAVVAAVMLLFVVGLNVRSVTARLPWPASLASLAPLTGLDQGWDMYSPPGTADYWFELDAKLADDSFVGLEDEGPGPQWAEVRRAHRDYRFKSFVEWLPSPGIPKQGYANWICRKWNADASGDDRMLGFVLVGVVRQLDFRGDPGPLRRAPLSAHPCPD